MTKTLTIKDEVYTKLIAIKGTDESFSDLFARLVDQTGSTEVLGKLRGSVTFEDKDRLLLEISESRGERRA